MKFMQALLGGATREANKNPNAAERTLIREATSVANQAMDAYYQVLSEKEDTEAFHEKLVQETETAQAAADLFQNFLERQKQFPSRRQAPSPRGTSLLQRSKGRTSRCRSDVSLPRASPGSRQALSLDASDFDGKCPRPKSAAETVFASFLRSILIRASFPILAAKSARQSADPAAATTKKKRFLFSFLLLQTAMFALSCQEKTHARTISWSIFLHVQGGLPSDSIADTILHLTSN